MGASESRSRSGNHRQRVTLQAEERRSKKKSKHAKKRLTISEPPIASEITHNSLLLSWPRPHKNGRAIIAYTVEMSEVKDRQWHVLTTTCQSNTYQVKNLQPDTEYQFRVRAENVYGLGEPSIMSDVIVTNVYNVIKNQFDASPSSPTAKPFQRHHSFNLQLEGGVLSILNHSSSVIDKDRLSSRSGDTLSRTSLDRNSLRGSLNTSRKRSLASLLPGSRTNTLGALKQSVTLPRESSLDELKFSSVSLESKDNVDGNRSNGCCKQVNQLFSDDTSKTDSQDSVNLNSSMSKNDMNAINENMSSSFLSAPISDDSKLAWYSKTISDSGQESADNVWHKEQQTDKPTNFRTLRYLLHSSDMIVKPMQSMPDLGRGIGDKVNNKLTTIIDEEEEDSVRVTTL